MEAWEVWERLKEFVANRQAAYQRTFDRDADSKMVLQDLAKFCRANKTTFDPDPRVHALLEGRKEVWIRIQQQLELSPEEIWKTYGKVEIDGK